MSTLILDETEVQAAKDDFSALEERILRAVELVKKEREVRAHAEQTVTRMQGQLDAQAALLAQAQEQVRLLEREREQVKQRVEKLLSQLDEIAS